MKKFCFTLTSLLVLGFAPFVAHCQNPIIWNVQKDTVFEVQLGTIILIDGVEDSAKYSIPINNSDGPIDTIFFNQENWKINKKIINGFGRDLQMWVMSESTDTLHKDLLLKLKQDDGEPENSNSLGMNESIIYDANTIKNQLPNSKLILDILKKYSIDSISLDANPYLNHIDKNIFNTNFGGSAGLYGGGTTILTTIGGLDVTKFAGALAKIVVEMAKKELTITYFKKFEEAINSPANKDLRTLFPRTAYGLLSIRDEVENFELGMLREQFEADMNLLPENFQKLIEIDTSYFNKNPKIKTIAQTASDIAIGIRDEIHPGDILQTLDAQGYRDSVFNLASVLETVQLISYAFKEKETQKKKRYWADPQLIKSTIRDPMTFQIFLGLVAQEAANRNIQFDNGRSLYDLLMAIEPNYQRLQPMMDKLVSHTRTIDVLIKTYKDSEQKASLRDISRYVNAINGVIQSGFGLVTELDTRERQKRPDVELLISSIDHTSHLFSNIVHKKFHAAVLNLLLLYDNYFMVKRINATENYAGQRKAIRTYMNFMAAMLQAESSNDVAAIIETYVLPSGSARVKRNSRKNISLNAYVGIYGGGEYTSWDNFLKTDNSGVWGVTAPVGVAYSWGQIGKDKHGSFSLFFSLIDIGAITSFRFNNDSSEVAKIYLKEIFSPGAFISVGLPNTPISINAGIQGTALLESVGSNENEVTLNRNIRLSLGLAVDIPLLNFYTRDGKRTK